MTRLRILSLFSAAAALAVGTALFQGNSLQAQESQATLQPAPAWKLKDLDGHEVSSAQFKGKVVIVDFWATWCGPCVGEIPSYVELQKKYGKDGLVIIGALTHDPKIPAKIKEFAAKLGMNYLIVVSDDATEEAFGGFEAIPTTFLISRDGRIIHQKTGALPEGKYEKLVQQALK
ncbi:MAG: TlpA disulfide reductase family protein [bacterium]|nr:TlpA disulfide reductase family protein [bacterium]MDI1337275.1 TlpA disulfide reductase family protein [Lacunisphaera sp.]